MNVAINPFSTTVLEEGRGGAEENEQSQGGNGAMLNMLAEVAAQTLRADHKAPSPKKKRSKDGKPSGMPLRQARNLSGNQLVRTFSRFEGDEMRRIFSFQCLLIPRRCGARFESFGSETRARNQIKDHLLSHLDTLPDGEILQVPKQRDVMTSTQAFKKTFLPTKAQKKIKTLKPVDSKFVEISEVPIEAFGEVVIEAEVKEEEGGCKPVQGLWQAQAQGAPDHDYILGQEDREHLTDEAYSAVETIWVKKEAEDDASASITDYVVSLDNHIDNPMLAVSNEVVVKTEENQVEQSNYSQINAVQYDEETADNIEIIPFTIKSEDLPILQDHRSSDYKVNYEVRCVERDEHRQHKKPKGKAKFIGQSAAEKEMAVRMIESMKLRLGPGEPLECQICIPPRSFTAPTTLISHYRSHAGIKPYECHICGGVFTRQHSLNYHLLIHSNKTRFTCSDCGRKFRHPSHFKEHQRRHTGEAPFECSDCDIRFKTRNTYKRHLKTRHGKVLTQSGGIIILSEEEFRRVRTAPRSLQTRVSSDKENNRRPRPKSTNFVRRKKRLDEKDLSVDQGEEFIQKFNLNGNWSTNLIEPEIIEIDSEGIESSPELILQAVAGEGGAPTTVMVLSADDILYSSS